MFIMVILALFGNGYQLQKKYDYCKEIKFEGDFCKAQKKLNKYEGK